MATNPGEDKLLKVFLVAGCLIEQEGKYLLIQEKSPDIYGLWNLPAGKVELGQTLKEAAVREAKEETGYDVRVIKDIGVYHKDGQRSVKHAFLARIIGGDLDIPDDEILDAKWLTYEEIQKLQNDGALRDEWVLRAIEAGL